MSNKQILWIYNNIKKYMEGVPDPDNYVFDLGNLWLRIKDNAKNKDEAKEAFKMLCTFRSILDAAAEEGVKL